MDFDVTDPNVRVVLNGVAERQGDFVLTANVAGKGPTYLVLFFISQEYLHTHITTYLLLFIHHHSTAFKLPTLMTFNPRGILFLL